MQYLVILDVEELIFLDGIHKCWIDISWRKLQAAVAQLIEKTGKL